jgi:hypothetical protein
MRLNYQRNMNLMRFLVIYLSLTLCHLSYGESRKWQNPDGTKEFAGEFISREDNSVTVKVTGGRTLTFPMEKLHAEDIAWLKKNHPTEEEAEAAIVPDEEAVFDTLKFGDDRETVTKKLKESKLLTADLDGTFFGRVGLNGLFRTKKEIGGLHFYVFFDWDEEDNLKEVTLQSADQTAEDYPKVIQLCWTKMIEHLTELYGKPATNGKLPAPEKIPVDQMVTSHFWKRNCLLYTSPSPRDH